MWEWHSGDPGAIVEWLIWRLGWEWLVVLVVLALLGSLIAFGAFPMLQGAD